MGDVGGRTMGHTSAHPPPPQANSLLIPAGVMADAWSSICVTGESISTNGFTTVTQELEFEYRASEAAAHSC